jgi:hypothetical protein
MHQQLADVRSPGLACVPVVNLLADLVAGYSISLLNTPFELIAFAIDRCEIIVSQFAPFLLDPALYHFPISFNAIPIHDILHYESYNSTVFQNLCSDRQRTVPSLVDPNGLGAQEYNRLSSRKLNSALFVKVDNDPADRETPEYQ